MLAECAPPRTTAAFFFYGFKDKNVESRRRLGGGGQKTHKKTLTLDYKMGVRVTPPLMYECSVLHEYIKGTRDVYL